MSARRTGTLWWLPRVLHCAELDPVETLLMVALAEHVDEDDMAWPSVRTLAAAARCSPDTVRRRMAALETRGFITRSERSRQDGGRTTDLVLLRRERISDGPPDTPTDPPDTPSQDATGPPRAQVHRPPSHSCAGAFHEPPIEPPSSSSPNAIAPDPDEEELPSQLWERFAERKLVLAGSKGNPAAWKAKVAATARGDQDLVAKARRLHRRFELTPDELASALVTHDAGQSISPTWLKSKERQRV